MAALTSSPATWNIDEVVTWARNAHLSSSTITALLENEVDGPTLVTLTKAELQTELGITSLPARRYLWELIKSMKDVTETSDYSAAMEVHQEEIQIFSSSNELYALVPKTGPDAGSGTSSYDPSLTAVVDELVTDAQRQRQIIDDHLLAYQFQRGMKIGQQVYEDVELARREQDRLNQLLQQAESDRVYAESLASRQERRELDAHRRREEEQQTAQSDGQLPVANQRISSLFGLCVQSCVDNKVNVADAFRAGNIKPMVVQVLDGDDSGEDDRKPAAIETLPDKLPFVEKCNTCFDENIKAYTLACGHTQCKTCARKLFREALKDNTLLPLRCCGIPIDMNISKQLLSSEEASLILQRVEEIEAKNKMYCPSCGMFLNLDLIDTTFSSNLLCGCGAAVCIVCKTASHPGISCEQNKAVQLRSDDLVLQLKEEKGWKQCPGCSMIIELRSGCNHITCSSCLSEFCYNCLSPWSTRSAQCSSGRCDLWDESRLIEAGEARVQQQEEVRGEALPQPVRNERLRAAIEGLRLNEVCYHEWERSNGYHGDCPNCGFTMYAYGMTCSSDCGSTVCYTCANHRLPHRGWR